MGRPLKAGGRPMLAGGKFAVTDTPPYGIAISNNSIHESIQQPDDAVGTLSASGTAPISFSLVDDAGGLFYLDGAVVRIFEGASFDYETAQTHVITVQATNRAGSTQADITINILNIDPPLAPATGDWSLANPNTGNALEMTISAVPASEMPITGAQYDVGGDGVGRPVPDYAGPGTYPITGLQNDVAADIRLRLLSAEGEGAWSAAKTATPTGDSTAPTLSSATDTANGSNAGTGSVTTNEGNGTLSWVLTTSATTPSGAQIEAMQDHTGASVPTGRHGSQPVTATGAQAVQATGLSASTTYYFHFVHRDAAGNLSAPISGDGFTTEAAASAPIPTGTAKTARSDSVKTAHSLDLPADIQVGERLLGAFRVHLQQASELLVGSNIPAGWEIVCKANRDHYVISKIADGSEGSSVAINLITAARFVGLSRRWAGAALIEGIASATADGQAGFDPSAIVPSWPASDAAVVAFASGLHPDSWNVNAPPSGYTGLTAQDTLQSGAGGCGIVSARVARTGLTSEDPGVFGFSSGADNPRGNRCATVAMRSEITEGVISSSGAWTDNEDSRAHALLGAEPEYQTTLTAQYTTLAGTNPAASGSLSKLELGQAGGPNSLVPVVWMTPTLTPGTYNSPGFRSRWVVDGQPQAWSAATPLTVTNTHAADMRSSIAEVNGNTDETMGWTLGANYECGQFADGEWWAKENTPGGGVVVTASDPLNLKLGVEKLQNRFFDTYTLTNGVVTSVANWTLPAGGSWELDGTDIKITKPGTNAELIAAQTVTGLTIGRTYRISSDIRAWMLVQIYVNQGAGDEMVIDHGFPGGNSRMVGEFTATVTSVTFKARAFHESKALSFTLKEFSFKHAVTDASTPEGGVTARRNGVSADLDFHRQSLDSRISGSTTDVAYAYGDAVPAGTILVSVRSEAEGHPNHKLRTMITLTVVSARPPAGSIRPALHLHGGRWRNLIRNMSEVDLSRVPEFPLAPGFPTDMAWFEKQVRRPMPPMGTGSADFRSSLPSKQGPTYHQVVRQDVVWAMVFAMCPAIPMADRRRYAAGIIARAIETLGAEESSKFMGKDPFYFWSAHAIWPGIVMRDHLMFGAVKYGTRLGDYSYNAHGGFQYLTWNGMVEANTNGGFDSLGRRRRRTDKPGQDTSYLNRANVHVWQNLIDGRVLNSTTEPGKFPYTPSGGVAAERAKLERLGLTITDDGTQITQIVYPPNRFLDGRTVSWIIDPTPNDVNKADIMATNPHAASPEKVDDKTGLPVPWPGSATITYIRLHEGQTALHGPILKACGGADYYARGSNSASMVATIYEDAEQWMALTNAFFNAAVYPSGNVVGIVDRGVSTEDDGAARNWNGACFDAVWLSLWDTLAPVHTPTAPAQATRAMFRAYDNGLEGLMLTLIAPPWDGWSPITLAEYSLNQGQTWLNFGSVIAGRTPTTPIAQGAGTYTVRMRFTNALGQGAASIDQVVPVASVSEPLTDDFNRANSGLDGQSPTSGPALQVWDQVSLNLFGLGSGWPNIVSNRLFRDGGSPAYAVIETFQSDGTLTIEYDTTGGYDRLGVVFRCSSDANQWWMACVHGGNLDIYKKDGATTIPGRSPLSNTGPGILTVVLNGSSITVTADPTTGVPTTINLTDAAGVANTRHGVVLQRGALDNIAFNPPA